jgi:hypothetical protein
MLLGSSRIAGSSKANASSILLVSRSRTPRWAKISASPGASSTALKAAGQAATSAADTGRS